MLHESVITAIMRLILHKAMHMTLKSNDEKGLSFRSIVYWCVNYRK